MTKFSIKSISNVAVLAIMAVALFSGCDSPAQRVEKANENVLEAKADFQQAMQDYQTEVASFKNVSNDKISVNEDVLAKFKAQMASVKKDAKANYEKQIAALEDKTAEMKYRLNEYQDGGMEDWQSFKTEFNHDIEALGKSINDLTVDSNK